MQESVKIERDLEELKGLNIRTRGFNSILITLITYRNIFVSNKE